MLKRAIAVLLPLGATVFVAAQLAATRPAPTSPDTLAVHEWGTFTTVAGPDGRAIDWLPLGGPADLPCFVEHFQNRANAKVVPNDPNGPLDYTSARASLRATVRMETPVLYFYAARATSARVQVRFPRGLMTEWYPHASVTQAIVGPNTMRTPGQMSVIEWPSVGITPGDRRALPVGGGDSHYYAARETDAEPLRVGSQDEKFLFYRGVADFDVPLSAEALADGSIRIRSLGADELPAVVVFENRHGALGYRIQDALRGETTLQSPVLNGTFPELRRDLERMLVSAGLYEKEAAAMVETWRDSLFEEGTRVFYIVPARAIDAILPLTIEPEPAHIARVFVGRMEVVTPAIEQAVGRAVAVNDLVELERYGRFLGPITDRLLAQTSGATATARIRAVTNAAFVRYLRREAACE